MTTLDKPQPLSVKQTIKLSLWLIAAGMAFISGLLLAFGLIGSLLGFVAETGIPMMIYETLGFHGILIVIFSISIIGTSLPFYYSGW